MEFNRFSNLQIMNLIRSFENQYPVETWVINGIHVWPIIRNNIPYLMIQKFKQKSSDNKTTKQNLKVIRFFSFIKIVVSSIGILLSIITEKKKDVLLVGDGISYAKIGEYWVDRFCDPLKTEIENEKKTCLKLEQVKNLREKKLYSVTAIGDIEKLAYYVSRSLNILHRSQETLVGYNNFFRDLKKYGIEKNLCIQSISMLTNQIKFMSFFFEFIIKKLKIKQIYIVCYYGIIGYGLALAGYRKKIDVTDIEHGSIINCPAYCDWLKVPEKGYEVLPSHFELWNQSIKDIFESTNAFTFREKHKAYVGGLKIIPYLQHQLQWSKSIFLENFKSKFECLILVTLQPQFYGHDDWNMLAAIIPSMSKKWGWIIRPHPAYRDVRGMENILSLNQSNVHYDTEPLNLYEVLKYVKCHITTASATCFESMIMDVPTIFISKVAVEDFGQIIDEKINYYAEGPTQIIKKLQLVMGRS